MGIEVWVQWQGDSNDEQRDATGSPRQDPFCWEASAVLASDVVEPTAEFSRIASSAWVPAVRDLCRETRPLCLQLSVLLPSSWPPAAPIVERESFPAAAFRLVAAVAP